MTNEDLDALLRDAGVWDDVIPELVAEVRRLRAELAAAKQTIADLEARLDKFEDARAVAKRWNDGLHDESDHYDPVAVASEIQAAMPPQPETKDSQTKPEYYCPRCGEPTMIPKIEISTHHVCSVPECKQWVENAHAHGLKPVDDSETEGKPKETNRG